MKELEPDYNHYAKCGTLTLEEFSLILHRINPALYNEEALSYALMFFADDNGQFLEPKGVTPKLFQKSLQNAYKTYDRLKRVDWSTKYGKNHFSLYGWPINWLFVEAINQELTIPEEFLKHHPSDIKSTVEIKNISTVHSLKNESLVREKGQQGKHFSDKRKIILKYAIGVVLKNQVSRAQSIFNQIKKINSNITQETNTEKTILATINKHIKPSPDFLAILDLDERLHGIILHVTFQLKSKHSPEKLINEIVTRSKEILGELNLQYKDYEIETILTSSKDLIPAAD